VDRRKRVLIVEDETLTAMLLEAFVEERGFASAGFYATGEDAVRKAKSEEPDLIFMDFKLSGRMDGMEAARIIEAERPIPIVIMSGYTERIVLEGSQGYKPAAFLSKPIDFEEVEGILASIA
jgi:CheY-like chemotaxis protein